MDLSRYGEVNLAVGFRVVGRSVGGDLNLNEEDFAAGIQIHGGKYREVSVPFVLEAVRNGLTTLIIDDTGFHSRFLLGARGFSFLKIGLDFKFSIFEPRGLSLEEHVFWLKRFLEQSFQARGRWREVFAVALTSIIGSGLASPSEVLDEIRKLYNDSSGVEKAAYFSLKCLFEDFLHRGVAKAFEAIEYPELSSVINGNVVLDFSWLPIPHRNVLKAVFLLKLSSIAAVNTLVVVERASRPFQRNWHRSNSDLVVKLRDNGFYTLVEDFSLLDETVSRMHEVKVSAGVETVLARGGVEESFKPIRYVFFREVEGEERVIELSDEDGETALEVLRLVNEQCEVGLKGLIFLLRGRSRVRSVAEELWRRGFLSKSVVGGERVYRITAKGLKALKKGEINGL